MFWMISYLNCCVTMTIAMMSLPQSLGNCVRCVEVLLPHGIITWWFNEFYKGVSLWLMWTDGTSGKEINYASFSLAFPLLSHCKIRNIRPTHTHPHRFLNREPKKSILSAYLHLFFFFTAFKPFKIVVEKSLLLVTIFECTVQWHQAHRKRYTEIFTIYFQDFITKLSVWIFFF